MVVGSTRDSSKYAANVMNEDKFAIAIAISRFLQIADVLVRHMCCLVAGTGDLQLATSSAIGY